MTYVAAIALSLLIWSTAGGFGGPYTAGASDIGTAVIYAVVFAGLLALSYYAGPGRLTVDRYLEEKISWWWKIAAGSQVSIQVISADPDTAHGLVITASGDLSSWMPMMTARPAFTGSALWFLGNPSAAGMHTGTLTFTAATAGTCRYLCPVPGHAQKGMTGQLIVSSAS